MIMVQKIGRTFLSRFVLIAVAILGLFLLVAKADSERAQRRAEANHARYERIRETEGQLRTRRDSSHTITTTASDRGPTDPPTGTSQLVWQQEGSDRGRTAGVFLAAPAGGP
jgi:hypothetical protein